ncbi:MAG: DUF1592 domain-containing protein [Myxococcales bacterium]|nr:DUF1592 domain-containing protein [Myxococcales bacterium]MCB9532372.1 DUF1592 domain-containing protein [Myxococcales bacterium]
MSVRSALLVGTLALAATASCVGAAGGSSARDGSADDEPIAANPDPPLRRLTEPELTASLQFLLGVGLEWPVEADLRVSVSTRVGATAAVVSERGVSDYSVAIGLAADRVAADPHRLRSVLRCDSLDDWGVCSSHAIIDFGALAWRRPVDPSEVSRYEELASQIATDTSDPVLRARTLLYALLISPNFLYRDEGSAEAEGDPLAPVAAPTGQYSGAAMASRLSFFIWNAPPDEPLLAAAAAGTLDTADGVAATASSMLQDPRAADGLDAFVDELFQVQGIASISREPLNLIEESAAFYIAEHQGLSGFLEQVRASEVEELHRIFRYVALDTDADLMDVFSTRVTFVNDTLMRFYDGEVDILAALPPRAAPPEEPERERGCLAPIEFICAGRDPCERFAERYCEFQPEQDCSDRIWEDLCEHQDACLDFFAETCPGGGHCAWQPEFGCVDPADGLIPETVAYDSYVPYGIQGWAMAERDVSESPRVGVLGTLGFLSLHGGSDSSPTRRGRFVLESLLCRTVGHPPEAALGAQLPMNGESRRHQHELMVSPPDCVGCHAEIDPIGFALDVYGPAGMRREKDRFGYPFDLSGSLDGHDFDGPAGLADLIATHPDSRACMARELFRFATGTDDDLYDAALDDALAAQFDQADGRYRRFVTGLVSSPEFRFRRDDVAHTDVHE